MHQKQLFLSIDLLLCKKCSNGCSEWAPKSVVIYIDVSPDAWRLPLCYDSYYVTYVTQIQQTDPRSWIPGSSICALDNGILGSPLESWRTFPMVWAATEPLISYPPAYYPKSSITYKLQWLVSFGGWNAWKHLRSFSANAPLMSRLDQSG